MDELHVAQTIIDTLSLPHHYRNVYFLGPTAERVSFASQQRRAFNLIWALNEKKGLPGQRVGVIGGGLAGITSAAAAIACGADVWLFEAASELCALQREVDKRFIHPTINFWPGEQLSTITDWPFLNWFAAPTREVISTVERQWKRDFESAARVECGAKVRTISADHTSVRLEFGHSYEARDFDLVIVAVGFGPERGLPNLEADSYWVDNEIDRTKITAKKPVWISGTGDGALIDCLRICFGGFDRGKLLIHAAAKFEPLRSHIAAIEAAAHSIEDQNERSLYLEKKYVDLVERPTVANFLSEKLAKFSPAANKAAFPLVSLVHRAASPFDSRTAPIHRVFLALALKAGLVRPIRGEMDSTEKGGGVLKKHGGGTEAIVASRIILRHGATGALAGLISNNAINDLESQLFRLHENDLNSQQWPRDYYEKLPSATFPSPKNKSSDFIRDAVTVLRGALSAYDITANFGVGVTPEKLHELKVQTTDGTNIHSSAIPQRVFGMQVKHEVVSVMATLHGWVPIKDDPLKVFPGVLVAFGEDSGEFRWHPLTCIGRHKVTNDIIGLCVTHQCNAADGAPVYLRLPRGEKLIGRVVHVISFDGWLQAGRGEDIACVLFELESGVVVQPAPDGMHLSGVLVEPVELLNNGGERKLKKWGPDPSTSEGRVNSVAGIVRVDTNAGPAIFSDVISVESVSKFSQPGDSGSLVVTDQAMAVGVIFAGTDNLTFLLPLAKLLQQCQIGLLPSSADTNAPDLNVLLELAWLRLDQCRFDEAVHLFQQALAQLEPRSDFSKKASAMHGLGVALHIQARPMEAEPLLRQALELHEKTLGDTHLRTASVLRTLAYVVGGQGKFEEAEHLFTRIVEIARPDHIETAKALKGLGWVLRRQHRFDEAAAVLKRALDISKGTSGMNHRDLSWILLELGWLAVDIGDFDEAKPYFERILELSEKDANIKSAQASAMHGLGIVLRKNARLVEAEALLRRALELRESTFAEARLEVASVLQTLAYVVGDQGKFKEAEELSRRIVEICEPNPNRTVEALKGLGWALRRQGCFAEAADVLKRALAIWELVPGVNQGDVSWLFLELGWLAVDIGDLSEAHAYFKRTLGVAKKGSDSNPAMASAMHGLGVVLHKQAHFSEAEPLLRQAFELRKSKFGETHPDVARVLQTLAYVVGDQGRFDEAEQLFRRIVDIRQHANGLDHSEMAAALKGLGWTLRRQLRFDEADAVLQQVSKIGNE